MVKLGTDILVTKFHGGLQLPRGSRTDKPVNTDPCPTLIVERGPNDQGVGSWVPAEKHRLLHEYLTASRHAWRRWPHRVFIDPFAGPGRIQVKGEAFTRDGGAVVAWRTLAKSVPFTRVLIGDIDPTRAGACEQRLKAVGAPVTSFVGPAVETIKSMVAAVPKRSLCLAYVDPYNLEYLSFSILRELAALRKIDLAVNFSTMDLQRNADLELDPSRARFDSAAPGWRDHLAVKSAAKQNVKIEFFRYWCEKVKSLDFKFSKEIPIVSNDHGHGIYRVAFFARHDLPIRLWGDVAKGPNISISEI